MIDFKQLNNLSVPEGNVVKISDINNNTLWVTSNPPAILHVAKETANVSANDTTYNNESFILFDIYPKTNGTVQISYGGLVKTITDTSGNADPEPQEVFFGTFKGESDPVETPDSGYLLISGDYKNFATGTYKNSKSIISNFTGVNAIESWGNSSVNTILQSAFSKCLGLTTIVIPDHITRIESDAFGQCNNLTSVIFTIQDTWKIRESGTNESDYVYGTVLDVSDPAQNAKWLNSIYRTRYWKRF